MHDIDVGEWGAVGLTCSENRTGSCICSCVAGEVVSSTEIRQIGLQGPNRDADKLFKAAVGAFSALTRPGRLDIAQLDDLTGPLAGVRVLGLFRTFCTGFHGISTRNLLFFVIPAEDLGGCRIGFGGTS